jgi:hypothetical protein
VDFNEADCDGSQYRLLLPGFAPGTMAQAQTASTGLRAAQAPDVSQPVVTDASAAAATTAAARADLSAAGVGARSLPRYNPGPNAVRDCTAT